MLLQLSFFPSPLLCVCGVPGFSTSDKSVQDTVWITGTDTCSWQFSQSFRFFLSRELESPRTQCHAVCHTPGSCGFVAWVTYSASLGLSAQVYVLTPSPCRTSLMIALVCSLYGFPASNFSCLLKLFISVHPDPNLQFPLRISI